MWRLFNRTELGAALVCCLLFNPALAQDYYGTLKGSVIDKSGIGVSGQTVTVSSLKPGFRRALTTDRNGRFQTQLPSGDYMLQTGGTGYSSVRIEHVFVGLGSTSDLTIGVAETAIEEIVVFGEATPLMATAVGETGLQFSLNQIAQLPVTRDIDAVALLAPGTVAGIESFKPTAATQPLVSFGGASVSENAYYVDGLNVSEYFKGFGGSTAPFEFYDQVQMKTGAFSAEFGRATGGVINAVTRRGSNDFEFGVVSYFTPEWGQGQSPDTYNRNGDLVAYASEHRESDWSVDVYAGGPIIKDRLFFFALYEPRERFSEAGDRGRTTETRGSDAFWGTNLTWSVNNYHSLAFTAFTDKQDLDLTVFEYDTEARSRGDLIGKGYSTAGGDNFITSYSGQLWERLSVSALYGVNKGRDKTWSTNDEECPAVLDYNPGADFRPGCEISNWVNSGEQRRDAYRLDLAYPLGNHTLRAGLDREDRESILYDVLTGTDVAPDLLGGVIYLYFPPLPVGFEVNGVPIPDMNGDGSPVSLVQYRYLQYGGTFNTDSRSWYVEDTWDLADSLTLSLGLRNEDFKNYNADGQRFLDIESQWAPRLGMSWSPKGEIDQTITINWGRFHQPMMAYPAYALGQGNVIINRFFVFDGQRDPVTAAPSNVDGSGVPTSLELGPPVVGTPTMPGDGSAIDARANIDTDLEPMYQDEWMIGYERTLGEDWHVGIRYIHREVKSVIEDVITTPGLEAIGFPGATDGSQPCRVVLTNPGTDISTFCDIDGVLTETFIPADALGVPRGRRTYKAIELVADKSLSDGWMFHGSYTWSQSKGNFEGLVDSDIAQDIPHYTQKFDLWQYMDGAYGYLPNDRRHKLRLWGLYEVSDRLTISAIATAQSGKPVNALGMEHPAGLPFNAWFRPTFYVRNPDGTLSYSPRGSAGRTHWVTQVDLSAIYGFRWGDRASVELRADVFNLFDSDTATEVNELTDFQPEMYGLPAAYQRPRQLRFGVAIRF